MKTLFQYTIDINVIVVSKSFLLVNKVFEYFIGYKILKKIDLYANTIQNYI